ncbi:immunoglobulin domain-containing protein, partial [Bacteroidota bacterium]
MKRFYFALAIAIMSTTHLQASFITSSGTISTNTTWYSYVDTVKVTGDLSINNGITLTIEKGVVVEFQGAYKLNVQGRLRALGAVNDRIVFTTTASNQASGWRGIRFYNTPSTNDTSLIDFCIIQYGNAVGSGYYDQMGGGIFVYNFSKLIIKNNIITNNQAVYYGAGIACWYYASPVIVNNLICHNSASSVAGGVMIYQYSNPVFIGNTVVRNKSNSYGGGIYIYYSTTQIKNCIIYGNDGGSYDQIYPSSGASLSYCNVENGYQGTGNIADDPLFVDPATGPGNNYNGLQYNYSVSTSSPVIDAGIGTTYGYLYPGIYDVGGNLRVDGQGVDIGAYEYVASTVGCGYVTVDTTWTGSVVITCDVTIVSGKTLTIAPGTKVKVIGDYKIDIKGRILAIGTQDSFITFNAVNKVEGWGGLYFYSLSSSNDTSKIEYCKIQDGIANNSGYSYSYYGGAITIAYWSKVILRNNIISNNYASSYGGGIYIRYSSAQLIGNVIVNNESGGSYGGGMYLYNYTSSTYTPVIINNTIANNKAYYYAGVYIHSPYSTFKNNIIWGNRSTYPYYTISQQNLYNYSSSTPITYSDVEGGILSGTGNISNTPLFKNPSTGAGRNYYNKYADWSLQPGSPCIDAGDNTGILGYLPETDLLGKVRVYNTDVDMGAYEDKSVLTVCGNITQDETWDANTIKINCDVTIDEGAIVTILPGAVVEFQGNYLIRVKGQMIALGTQTDSIKFTALNPSTGWAGLRFDSFAYQRFYGYNGYIPFDTSKFKHCIFEYAKRTPTSNYYDCGAAIQTYYYSKLSIKNCRFSDNEMSNTGSYYYNGKGGAVYLRGGGSNAEMEFENNLFYRNSAYYGGALYVNYYRNSYIKNNTFIHNSAVYAGGGVYATYNEDAVFESNYFSNNTAGNYGGGMYYQGGNSDADLINNIFVNNESSRGGGIYIGNDSKTNLINNTICNNKATSYGGAIYATSNADPIIKNTIIYGNSANNTGDQVYINDVTSDPKFYYCNIQGDSTAFEGTGAHVNFGGVYLSNIDSAPAFVSPSGGAGKSYNGYTADWSITNASPCINLGTPSAEGLNLPELDMNGNVRVFNGRVDIGAYENQDPVYAACVIEENTIWDADTIKVGCNVKIKNGKTLTVMPGTFVEFTGNYMIDVKGRILALGTADEPIIFATTDTAGFYDMDHASWGGWKGIRFNSPLNTNDTSKLIYCTLKYGKGDSIYTYTHNGGALYIYNYSKVVVSNCLISNNMTGRYGGAVYIESGDPVFTNNIIVNNSALSHSSSPSPYTYGGAFYIDDGNPILANNTIANNFSQYIGGGLYSQSASPIVKNNIIYNNKGDYNYNYYDNIYLYGGNAVFHNNDIEMGSYCYFCYNISSYLNNITQDPEFTSPSSGAGAGYDGLAANWNVSPQSPVLNNGTPSVAGLMLGAYDFEGNRRNVADTVDIGAYEIQISERFISQQPSNRVVCQGSNTSFVTQSIVPVSYQWYKDGNEINGADYAIYFLNNIQTNQAGNYYCVMSNPSGSMFTDTVSLTVLVSPTVTSNPSSIDKCIGQSATFSVSGTGSTPLSYQWYNTNGQLNAATNSTYTITSVVLNDASSYYCIISNTCGSDQSNGASLTLKTPPEISSLNSSTTVCEGSTPTYTVSATGSPTPTYQWYKDGNNMAGKTNQSLSITSATTSDQGSYYCKALNECGADSTNTSYLYINTAPTITSQTQTSVSVCTGQSMTFNVNADGTTPLSYQWYDGSGTISGATGSTYTINSVSTSDAGSYYCKVTNACGNDQSNTITLTVNTPPTITAQSGNTSACSGSTATFSVTVSGSPAPTYKWYFGSTEISGATNNQYTTGTLSSSNAGSYFCIATNSCGTATSTVKTLTVNTAPSITAQTATAVAVCAGQGMTFSVTATGSSPLNYQWYNTSGAINGATGSTYTLNSAATSDAGNYYCIVTNTCGNDQCNTIALTVRTAPSFTSQSGNQTVCSGSGASFSVTGSGTPTPTYQWYYNTASISGATNNALNLSSVSTSNAGDYYCIATNTCGTATSNSRSLTVNTGPTITYITSNSTVCDGQSLNLSVSASGTSPFNYQWYKNSSQISGATNYFYSISSASTADSATYYCNVSNTCSNVNSSNVVVTVKHPPVVTSASGTTSACSGSAASFSVTASGSIPINYQWYKNNSTISGATNSTYQISSTSAGSAGTYYCKVMNSCGSTTTASMPLSILQGPSVTYITPGTTICSGQSMIFTISATGTAPFTYQWYKGSTLITGAVNNTFTIFNATSTDAGSYKCKVTNSCSNVFSSVSVLSINQPPSISSQPSSTTVCEDVSVSFVTNASGANPISYQWYLNGSPITSATNKTYSIAKAKVADAGSYYCIASNSCGSAQSTTATLTMNTKPVVVTYSDSTTMCVGHSEILSIGATGTNPITYQWYRNMSPITNATNSYYLISSVK